MAKTVIFYSSQWYDAYMGCIACKPNEKIFTPEAEAIMQLSSADLIDLLKNDNSFENRLIRQDPKVIEAVEQLGGKIFASEERKAAIVDVPREVRWEIARDQEWCSDYGGFVAEYVREMRWEVNPWKKH